MADSSTGEQTKYAPPADFRERAHIRSMADYKAMYRRSVDDNEGFWREQAERLDWFQPFKTVKNVSYASENVSIAWYEGGKLNACYNAIDRHLETRRDRTALIYEADDPEAEGRRITYGQLHEDVCRFANVLKKHGVKKGGRVTIYLPMIPEAAYAMLACARLGAIHSVVFAGFSPDSLADRILDCESDFLITADEGMRGGRPVPLKKNANKALERCPGVKTVLVVQRTGGDIGWTDGRDVWYHDERETVDAQCEPEKMDAEDPLFILYTSGSTGKPKGVVHTTGGYCVYTSLTHEYVFDLRADEDVYWCAADVGWITGHSYIVYGPPHQRGHAGFLREHADLPGRLAPLEDRRQVPGDPALHSPDSDPRAHARRRGPRQEDGSLVAAPARHRRRADQPGGVAVVPRGGRRGALPHC